ncbi:MAG: hypothetical protein AB8B66_04225 [Rickettsiaceae bacterium]
MSKQQPKMYYSRCTSLPFAVKVPVFKQSNNDNSLDIYMNGFLVYSASVVKR